MTSPRAAVPGYLTEHEQDFPHASPQLKFNLLLPNWTDTCWGKCKSFSKWDYVCEVSDEDQRRAVCICQRQKAMAKCLPQGSELLMVAKSIAPFTTGLGNEHPLENGFSFLTPYGLPYLPGSGVKGVVRRAAEELAGGDWGNSSGWRLPLVWYLFGFEPWPAPKDRDARREWEKRVAGFQVGREDINAYLDTVCGADDKAPAWRSELERNPDWRERPLWVLLKERQLHTRGALSFWDVIPALAGDKLVVDVMTPHYSHYYQQKQHEGSGSESPHDSGQPNPINFLTVPPDSEFAFRVVCDRKRLPPELSEDDKWKKLLESAFEHAFEWCGFGAKTAVGYGAMKRSRGGERCAWVERTIKELADKNHAKEEVMLRGKLLADAWQKLEDQGLKDSALADIKTRWEEKGWWGKPPGPAAKKAFKIYSPDSQQ